MATAARAQVNAAIAIRLIPKNTVSSTVKFISGILLLVLGPGAILTGMVFALSVPEAEMKFLASAGVLVGFVFTILAALLIFVGQYSDVYRNMMRAHVQSVLNNEQALPYTGASKEPKWLPGHEPRYWKRHKMALSPDVRQSFSYFMKNAPSASQGSTSATE